MSISIEAIRDLSVEEKLQLIEQLWEQLSTEDQALPISEAIRNETRRRSDEISSNAEVLTRNQVWQQVDQQRG